MAQKKRTTKKSTKPKFPSDCPHKNFFGCKTPTFCTTCYYNPDIKQTPWFYSDKRHAKKMLDMLEDIRLGRGLRPGGKRTPWKYARKDKEEQ